MNNDDIVEINQVMGLYAHVIDGKQWHRLDELYTDDGVFDLTGLMGRRLRFEGIDAIKGFLTSMPMPLAHIATNTYVFEEDGVVQSRGKWFMPTDEGTDQRWRLPRRVGEDRSRMAPRRNAASSTGPAPRSSARPRRGGPRRGRTCDRLTAVRRRRGAPRAARTRPPAAPSG